MIAAIACASLGVAGVMPTEADGTVRDRQGKRNRNRRPLLLGDGKPARQQHAGTREIARRQRQEAKRIGRTDAC